MKKLAILTPVYKPCLDTFEQSLLDHSLSVLSKKRDIFFIAPNTINQTYYTKNYPQIPFILFPATDFISVTTYNQLMLSAHFYQQFDAYEFVLILQTDAIMLRDDLDYWCLQAFDYIGAPWRPALDIEIGAERFLNEHKQGIKQLKLSVGNGGLSLRRVKKCLKALADFKDIADMFIEFEGNEDIFFAMTGELSSYFSIPEEMIAAQFSCERSPSYYVEKNHGKLPMGGHALQKHEPYFWKKHLINIPF